VNKNLNAFFCKNVPLSDFLMRHIVV